MQRRKEFKIYLSCTDLLPENIFMNEDSERLSEIPPQHLRNVTNVPKRNTEYFMFC